MDQKTGLKPALYPQNLNIFVVGEPVTSDFPQTDIWKPSKTNWNNECLNIVPEWIVFECLRATLKKTFNHLENIRVCVDFFFPSSVTSAGSGTTPTDFAMDITSTPEPSTFEQEVVILMDEDKEIPLGQSSEQIEREVQSFLETIPLFSGPPTNGSAVEEQPRLLSNTTEPPLTTTDASENLRPFDRTSSSPEEKYDSGHTTALNDTIQSTEMYYSPQNVSFQSTFDNSQDPYQNFTDQLSELESTTSLHDDNATQTQTQNLTDNVPKESTQSFEKVKLLQDLDLNSTHTESYEYETKEEILETPPVTLDPKEKEEPATTTETPADLSSLLIPVSGSGDTSQGKNSIASEYTNALPLVC